jgi:hypothetical protein
MKAMTPAQRQAAYRQRHSINKSRINLLVSGSAKWKLYQLAYSRGVSMTKMLEQIIEGAV